MSQSSKLCHQESKWAPNRSLLELLKTKADWTEDSHLCLEVDFWGLEGIVGREVDHNEEHTTSIWALARPHDGGLPVEEILSNRPCAAGGRRILLQVLQLFLDPLTCHDSRPDPALSCLYKS